MVDTCPVCLDAPPNHLTACGHAFCADCIARLYNPVCPLCRSPLVAQTFRYRARLRKVRFDPPLGLLARLRLRLQRARSWSLKIEGSQMKLCLGGRCFLRRYCTDVASMTTQGDVMMLRVRSGESGMMSLLWRMDESVALHIDKWFKSALV